MAARFPGLARRGADRARALDVRRSTTSSRRRCTASRHRRLLDARHRRSRGCATIGVPTLVLNARNDPFLPAAVRCRRRATSCARSRSNCRRTAGTSVSPCGRFPAHRWLPQRLLHSSVAADEPRLALADHAAARRNLQGLRHPRHRRPDAHRGRSSSAIGRALGTARARARRCDTFVVGRDGRLSGPELAERSRDGLRAAGANVIDIGMVATPMVYFAAHHLAPAAASMVTGSHNPPDYNGLKMVIAGDTLSGDDIQDAAHAHRGRRVSRTARASFRSAGRRATPTSSASPAT